MTASIFNQSKADLLYLNLRIKGMGVSHDDCRKCVKNDLLYAVKFLSNRGEATYIDWFAMHKWCEGSFGKGNYSWSGPILFFKTDENAVLFKLRWG